MTTRYRALRFFIFVLRVIGYLLFGVATIAGLSALNFRLISPLGIVLNIIGGIVGGGLAFLALNAIADQVEVLLHIEENTRATVIMLRRISRQLPPLDVPSSSRSPGGMWDEGDES